MSFIRFIDDKGRLCHGVDLGGGRAELLAQSPMLGVARTGEVADVERLLCPVEPSNIFGIGLNYRRHAMETKMDIPEHPIIFMKPTSSVAGPGDTISIPMCQMKGAEVDFEGELAIVIGSAARDVSLARAMDHVLGFTCSNDVSARRWQKHGGGGQWVRAKSFDTFCPLGPRLVPKDEIGNWNALDIRTTLNGEIMQESNTRDMIFGVEELVSRLSKDTTLLPGTVILTGTPEGVGFTRKPPRFLMPGDEVRVWIEGIGELINPVTARGAESQT